MWQESPVYKQRKYKCNLRARGSFFTESCAEPCRCLFHFHYSSKGLELAIHHIVFFVPRSQNMDLIVNYREQKSFNSLLVILLFLMPLASCFSFPHYVALAQHVKDTLRFSSSIMWTLCLVGYIAYWYRVYQKQRGGLHSISSSPVLLVLQMRTMELKKGEGWEMFRVGICRKFHSLLPIELGFKFRSPKSQPNLLSTILHDTPLM